MTYSDPVNGFSVNYPDDWTVNPFPHSVAISNGKVHAGAHYFFEPGGALVSISPLQGPMPTSGNPILVGKVGYPGYYIQTAGVTDTSQAGLVVSIPYEVGDSNWVIVGSFGTAIDPDSPELAIFAQMVKSVIHSPVRADVEYVSSAVDALTALQDSTNRYLSLLTQAQQQPSLLFDSNWLHSVNNEFSIWKQQGDVLKQLHGPAVYSAYDVKLWSIADQLNASANDFQASLQHLNGPLVKQSGDEFHAAQASIAGMLPELQEKKRQLLASAS